MTSKLRTGITAGNIIWTLAILATTLSALLLHGAAIPIHLYIATYLGVYPLCLAVGLWMQYC